MSDTRAVFTILEDDSSADGVKLPARAEGTASAGNHVPSIVAKDGSGNYALLRLRQPGDAISGNELPVLPVKDLAGNYQHINARDEGDAVVGIDALPALTFKNQAGNFKYPLVNTDGEVIVAIDKHGVNKDAHAVVTPVAINTLTTVVEQVLTVSKLYEEIQIKVASGRDTMWELVQNDNAVLTVLDSYITGSGQYTFTQQYSHKSVTAGSTGTQKLFIRATQLAGAVSDFHGYIAVFEKV